MTQTQTTLIVMIDAEDVKSAFTAWPDDICLAACLDRNGDCSMVVFLKEERPYLPDRLIELLGKDEEEICFVPRVPGFATRTFLYSDERRLMALIASDPSVLEMATDYAVNVTYALEEGLDPEMILGLSSRGFYAKEQPQEKKPSRRKVTAEKTVPAQERPKASGTGELSPLLPDFLRKSAEHTRRPRFSTVRTARTDALLAEF